MNARNEDADPDPPGVDLLLARARADRPDTALAEYGFETRLKARLAARKPSVFDGWASWTWRLAPAFAVVAVSLSLWIHFTPAPATDDGVMAELSASPDDELAGWLLEDFLPPS